MAKIIVVGYMGRLGGAICRLASSMEDVMVAAGVDVAANSAPSIFPVYQDISECAEKADCIIDCSLAPAVPSSINYAMKTNTPLVVCTTGLSEETLALMREASKSVPIFCSANMSLGINLMCALSEKLVKILANAGFDVEIVEKHHNKKLDAPSGTAFMLADAINDAAGGTYEYIYDRSDIKQARGKNEMGIHAVRGGTIFGEHEVIFAGNEELLEIKHSIASRDVFATGALKAALYTAKKQPGMYDMKQLIDEA